MTAPVLELRDVSFSYGERRVLGPIGFRVSEGELVFVVGPNGAGKSTLLRLIAGLERPGAGSVRCMGLNPFATERHLIAQKLAFLPQAYDLTFPFTVAEVVLLGRFAHGRRGLAGFVTRPEDRESAERAMARCDVAEFARRRWNELSGGEQRRVLLAQTFCQDAEILLLDEPTASLDPAHAIDIFETVRAQRANRTTVVVTHDLNLAARFGDRLIVISDGALVSDGSPAEVLDGPEARDAFSIDFHVGTLPGSDRRFVVPR